MRTDIEKLIYDTPTELQIVPMGISRRMLKKKLLDRSTSTVVKIPRVLCDTLDLED